MRTVGCALYLPACASCAQAAAPQPDGQYQGTTSQGKRFPVGLRVAGESAVARLSIAWRASECQLARCTTDRALRRHAHFLGAGYPLPR